LIIEKILEDRERRWKHVLNFQKEHGGAAILVKANIPGFDKNIKEAGVLVRVFEGEIARNVKTTAREFAHSFDGPYVIFGFQNDNRVELKKKLVEIESTHPLGRFIDFDLHVDEQQSMTRKSIGVRQRGCFLCNNDAIVCMRNQTHRVEELLACVEKSIRLFCSQQIHRIVDQAMMMELDMEDKFGLVTKTSKGSHLDMDYEKMIKAKNALLPFFTDFFNLGYENDKLDELFRQGRRLGVVAEKAMFEATEGINCYKGLIFVLGVFLMATGRAIASKEDFAKVFENVRLMTFEVRKDFDGSIDTFGKTAREKYGIEGVRGEAMKGFPTVLHGVSFLKEQETTCPKTLRKLLIQIILSTDDTCFLKRAGSIESYRETLSILNNVNPENEEQVNNFHKFAIQKNLSFGGSADLLIASIAMLKIDKVFFGGET